MHLHKKRAGTYTQIPARVHTKINYIWLNFHQILHLRVQNSGGMPCLWCSRAQAATYMTVMLEDGAATVE